MPASREKAISSLRSFLYASLIAAFIVCSLPPMLAAAAEQKKAEPAKTAAPAPPAAPAVIALADIATRATEVSNLVGTLTASAAPSAQIERIAKTLPEFSEKLDAQFVATTRSLDAAPTLETLQNEQQVWQSAQLQATGWLTVLTQHATKLQGSLSQLADLQKIWSSTRASAQAANAPGPILQQIDATLTIIIEAQAPLQAQRANILNLQSRVAEEATRCGTALQRIEDFQQKAVAGIFVPDAPPIWTISLWSDAVAALPDHVGKIARAYWADVAKYIRDPRQGGALHPALFFVLAAGVFCGAAQDRYVGKVRRGCIVGDPGLRATLRSGVGHHSGFGDCAFIFSVAHHGAAIADDRIAGADAPPGAANDQCLGRVRALYVLFSVRRRYPAPDLCRHTSDRSGDPCRRSPCRDHRAVLDAAPLSANHRYESGIFRSDRPEG